MTASDVSAFPNRELRTSRKMWKCIFWKEKLNVELLWNGCGELISGGNDETNGKVLGPNTQHATVLTLGNPGLPASVFWWKERHFHTQIWF